MAKEQVKNTKTKHDNFLMEMYGNVEVIMATLDAHTDIHKAILTQTTNTNGKVAEITKWKERMNGGILVCAFVIPTFFGVIGWMAYQITNFDKQIQEALSVYEIPQ